MLVKRLVIGMRQLRLQRLDLHSLERRRLQANLIAAFKIFTGILDIDINLFFFPPARRGLRRHPYKVLQGASRRRYLYKLLLVMLYATVRQAALSKMKLLRPMYNDRLLSTSSALHCVIKCVMYAIITSTGKICFFLWLLELHY